MNSLRCNPLVSVAVMWKIAKYPIDSMPMDNIRLANKRIDSRGRHAEDPSAIAPIADPMLRHSLIVPFRQM